MGNISGDAPQQAAPDQIHSVFFFLIHFENTNIHFEEVKHDTSLYKMTAVNKSKTYLKLLLKFSRSALLHFNIFSSVIHVFSEI